jgi:PAS domain S-box-containing protein
LVEQNKKKETIHETTLENALASNEDRYLGLLENLNAGIVVHASDTSIIMNNNRASELLGLSYNEMLGKKSVDLSWNFILEDNTICPLELFPVNRIQKNKQSIHNQIIGIIRPNLNDIVWVMVNGFPSFDKDGNIFEITISFIDITKQKKMEEELLRSKANMMAVLDHSNQAIVLIDKKSKILFLNRLAFDIAKSLYGFEIKIGSILNEIVPQRNLKAFKNNFKLALEGKQITSEKLFLIEEKERWLELQYAPVKDDSLDVIGVLFTVQDISEKKKAIIELRLSEIRFHTIFDRVPLGIAVLESKSGKFKQINPKLCKILDYEKEEILARSFQDVTHPDDLLQNLDKLRLLLDGKTQLITMDNRYIRKDQTVIWVNITYVPLNMENKSIEYHIVIVSDITEAKKVNEQAIEYTESLLSLNATKDKFFNIIAHDLRNPFAGIIGLSEMMETELKEAGNCNFTDILKYVQLIKTSSKSALALLENLMQWAKSQRKEISYSPKNIYIEEIIDSSLELVIGSAFKKKIAIEKDFVNTRAVVFADSALTNTILRNLLTNAIKFSFPENAITILTKLNGDFLEISIKDTGIGIKADNLDKLFRIDSKFTKLGTDREKGTGLGLILCKEFVEKQHGRIWVESKFGKGSTFTFTLPLAR